jgi:beta-xylosidase
MKTSARILTALLVMASSLFVMPRPVRAETRTIEVDFSKVVGAIKPLNGVNGGPLMTRGAMDLSSNFSELGIKHVRLHDVPWMYENVVDIEYVFPRFEADVNDPQSYDFFLTDHYIKAIKALGAEITYRLGYSAEWTHHPPLHNAPPKDFGKWAAICAHIVQHYNQGWANGYHFSIKYWEIWNEADQSGFWTGTALEYYKLYELTAKAIKSADPSVKVGGPAMADHYEFVEGLLDYCRENKAPLDFISWHTYCAPRHEPYLAVSRAAKMQELLDKHGFPKAESVLDEWSYFWDDWDGLNNDAAFRKEAFANRIGGIRGAAFDASVLIYLQDTSVAIADFFSGSCEWFGLFDEFGVPRKPYFTFKAFKFLLETPERVFTSGSGHDGFAVIAGISKDKSEATILISNFVSAYLGGDVGGKQYNHYDIILRGLPWDKPFIYKNYAVDRSHDLDLIKSEKLGPGTVTILEDVETPSLRLIHLGRVP